MKKEGEEDDRDLSKLILADTASAIPPLSQQPPPMAEGRAAFTSTSRKRTRTEAGQETERGRREKMSDMYALLQTMVPTLFPKVVNLGLPYPVLLSRFFDDPSQTLFLGFWFLVFGFWLGYEGEDHF